MADQNELALDLNKHSQTNGRYQTQPILIQPARIQGKSLVHMPPQIVHVPTQHISPAAQSQPVGIPGTSSSSAGSVGPPYTTQARSAPRRITRHTPTSSSYGTATHLPYEFQNYCELSPTAPRTESATGTSTSFNSAQSELNDDLIVEEILGLEDEQRARSKQLGQPLVVGSYPTAMPGLTNVFDPRKPNTVKAQEIAQYFNDDVEMLDNVYSPESDMPHSTTPYDPASGHMPSDAPSPLPPHIQFARQISCSAPTAPHNVESMVRAEMEQNERERRKKDIHNMIERKRRYHINDRIKELGDMLPKSQHDKINKGTILKASVDYIRELQLERQRLAEQVVSKNAEANAMRSALQSIVEQMQVHGLSVPSTVAPLLNNPAQASSSAVVKQEPMTVFLTEEEANQMWTIAQDLLATLEHDSVVGRQMQEQEMYTMQPCTTIGPTIPTQPGHSHNPTAPHHSGSAPRYPTLPLQPQPQCPTSYSAHENPQIPSPEVGWDAVATLSPDGHHQQVHMDCSDVSRQKHQRLQLE